MPGCQRISSTSRPWLHQNIQSRCQTSNHQNYLLHCCSTLLVHSTTRCQQCIPTWNTKRRCVHDSASRICRFHIAFIHLQIKQVNIWLETRTTCLVWRASSFLLTLGFQQSKLDPSLFIYSKNDITLFLLVYIDDVLITSSESAAISNIIRQLGNQFSLNDLGKL